MTPRQNKALQGLLCKPTKRQAAEYAGISESTMRSYLSNTEFMSAYREAVTGLLDDASREAKQALSPALSTLREITEDSTAPASARIAGARSLLEFGLKLTELTDVMSRMTELEKTVAELEGNK